MSDIKTETVIINKQLNKDTRSSDIHNVFINHISLNKIKILKSESSIKNEFMTHKKMTPEKYAELSKPFLMTDILCDEIMNLEYKQSGNQTQVKQISKGINKDKFSALEYGLYWIYLEERKNQIKKQENYIDISKLFNFKKPQIRKR